MEGGERLEWGCPWEHREPLAASDRGWGAPSLSRKEHCTRMGAQWGEGLEDVLDPEL